MHDSSMEAVLRIGSRILALPVIHGSADCALEVRRIMLQHSFDCVAVPLPPSFREDVEAAVQQLPAPAIVLQRERSSGESLWAQPWHPDEEQSSEQEERVNYVPIDPCQPVIAALRIALGERLPRAYIDRETGCYESQTAVLPDPYALKKVALHRFAAAILPSLQQPAEGQTRERILAMATRLRELETRYRSILLVCSVLDWAWIRDAFCHVPATSVIDDEVEETERYGIDDRTLLFLLGELPYITYLYEHARAELEDDENLSIDGVKQLLLSARCLLGGIPGKGATDHATRPEDLSEVHPQPHVVGTSSHPRSVHDRRGSPTGLRR